MKRFGNNSNSNSNKGSSTVTTTTTSSPHAIRDEDGYLARRSNRVSEKSTPQHDGHAWQETLSVCEVNQKLAIRSYYVNVLTKERKWDEPPSGATQVIKATDQMRKMAKLQLQEMKLVVDAVNDSNDKEESQQPTKKLGGLFRNKNNKTKNNNNSIATAPPPSSINGSSSKKNGKHTKPSGPRIQYKADGLIGRMKRERKYRDQRELDLSIQRAVATSLAETQNSDGAAAYTADASDLEMALALSVSETAASADSNEPPAVATAPSVDTLTEEEQLQMAMEESLKMSASTSPTSSA